MGSVISGLGGGASAIGGSIFTAGSFVGQYAFMGIEFVASFVYESGSWVLGCVSLGFSVCTNCICKSWSEVLRPVQEYEDSEAKRVGVPLCILSCFLTCVLLFILATTIAFTATYVWYLP